MPFDGTSTKGFKAVQALDGIIELFDGGKYWCQGWGGDGTQPGTSMCLDHALRAYRIRSETHGDHAGDYLRKAIREYSGGGTIWYFNDHHRYPEIEKVVARARELALQDI